MLDFLFEELLRSTPKQLQSNNDRLISYGGGGGFCNLSLAF